MDLSYGFLMIENIFYLTYRSWNKNQ